MQVSSLKIKSVLLSFVIASALPILACSDDNDTPTSPTQPGPPVSNPPPAPDPDPDPDPDPPPPPTDDRPIVTVTGNVANLNRTGPNGLDISFRIDDFTIVRASASTPVISGSTTGDTSYVRSGQTLSVEGRRDNGFLDATRITIVSP